MQRRREHGHPLDNLWEFPGGKIKKKETAQEASQREIREEVGIDVNMDKAKPFRFYHCDYDEKSYCLHVFLGRFEQLPVSDGQQWFSVGYEQKSHILNKKIPPVNHLILDDILQYAETGGAF